MEHGKALRVKTRKYKEQRERVIFDIMKDTGKKLSREVHKNGVLLRKIERLHRKIKELEECLFTPK